MNKPTDLTLATLTEAVSGKYSAVRRVTRLEPLGHKVFPPTYEGGEYADETRQVRAPDGTVRSVETILLDSVQSQANRMELALLRAYDAGKLKMPMLQVEFAGDLADIGRLTALEAPHRMCDAIFRDSDVEIAGTGTQAFRHSPRGAGLDSAKTTNATPVFELCPTALVFGFWDSTGPRGGSGAKVQRALVSEIVGFETVSGKRTASRIDPLQIDKSVLDNAKIFRKGTSEWTFNEAEAATDEKGHPVTLKPSDINHGNIVPSFRHDEKNSKNKVLNHGGVTLAYAEQQTVLSLAALRRLRFPLPESSGAEIDLSARTVLAALALAAICFLDDDGYDLRSRCLLDGKPGVFELIGRGDSQPFTLTSEGAAALLSEAVAVAVARKLPWPEEPVRLKPSEKLHQLVMKSRLKSVATIAGE